MHTAPMPDSAGDFDEWKTLKETCSKCNGGTLQYRVWESSDGGYEDHQYRCLNCGDTWWIDGPDA